MWWALGILGWTATLHSGTQRLSCAASIRQRLQLLLPTASWDAGAWAATSWEQMNTFDRQRFLQGLLDGDIGHNEANHAAWRGLGYTVAPSGTMLLAPDGTECSEPPDVLGDTGMLERLNAELPQDDDDEMMCLDTLVENLHGEDLTRILVEARDTEFLARRTLVCWLYTTQTGIALG